jgi:PEP-CTERM motif-containing protein
VKSRCACWLFAPLVLLAISHPAVSAVGPTSTLYIINYGEFSGGTVTGLDLVQGVTLSSYPTAYRLGMEFDTTIVPEPSSVVLLTLGAAVWLLLRRRIGWH